MLRRRLEKLELRTPPAGDLLEQWDRRALACLSYQDRVLVAEVNAAHGRGKQTNSTAHAAALERYQEALTQTIAEVSDADLDRIIASVQRSSPGALQ